MRPPGTNKQLAKRRQRALEMLKGGMPTQEVARRMGVTERSVRRWQQEAKHPKKKSPGKPGKPSYLTPRQIQRLERELLRGA